MINLVVCFLLGNSPVSEFYIPVFLHTYPPRKMEQTECSETLAYKIQTWGNYPEESIQHAEHDESLKSRMNNLVSAYENRRRCSYVSGFLRRI